MDKPSFSLESFYNDGDGAICFHVLFIYYNAVIRSVAQ